MAGQVSEANVCHRIILQALSSHLFCCVPTPTNINNLLCIHYTGHWSEPAYGLCITTNVLLCFSCMTLIDCWSSRNQNIHDLCGSKCQLVVVYNVHACVPLLQHIPMRCSFIYWWHFLFIVSNEWQEIHSSYEALPWGLTSLMLHIYIVQRRHLSCSCVDTLDLLTNMPLNGPDRPLYLLTLAL